MVWREYVHMHNINVYTWRECVYMHVFGGSVCTRVCRFGVSVHVYMVRVCAGLEGVCVHGTCVCRFGGSVYTRYVCVQVWRECVFMCVFKFGGSVCEQVWREYVYMCVQGQDRVLKYNKDCLYT